MAKVLLTTVTVLGLGASVLADDIVASWAEVDYVRPEQDLGYDLDQYEAEDHRVFDLIADPVPNYWWVDAGALAYFHYPFDPQPPGTHTAAAFWEHPNGGDKQPDASTFGDYGLLPYESFWTTPEEYPNPDVDPAANATYFGPGSPIITPYERFAEWYVDPESPSVEGDVYTVARFNFTVDCSLCPVSEPYTGCVDYDTGLPPACVLIIEGAHGGPSVSKGPVFPFYLEIPVCWCIPEPGSAVLLVPGGLWLLSRRRRV